MTCARGSDYEPPDQQRGARTVRRCTRERIAHGELPPAHLELGIASAGSRIQSIVAAVNTPSAAMPVTLSAAAAPDAPNSNADHAISSAAAGLLTRIPLVQAIYGSTKKLLAALQTKPEGVQRVVLIDFPAPPLKTVALVTKVMRDTSTGRENGDLLRADFAQSDVRLHGDRASGSADVD